MKIIFFIDSLRAGGRERRMIELLHYLKINTGYEMHIVSVEKEVHYKDLYSLDVPVTIVERKMLKKDPLIFKSFYNIAKQFQPDIIHTWGTMATFYAIPAKVLLKRPMVANLISNAQKDY